MLSRLRRRLGAGPPPYPGTRFYDRHALGRAVDGPIADARRCQCPGAPYLEAPQCAEVAETGRLYCRPCDELCRPTVPAGRA